MQLSEYINKLISLIDGKYLISKVNKLNSIKDDYEFFHKKLNLFLPFDKSSNKSIDLSNIDEK